MQAYLEVLGNPNRENIRYAVMTIDIDKLYAAFSWLIDELIQKNINTQKVIVSCRRKQHMKFQIFTHHLRENSYYMPTGNEPIGDRSRLFAMYHKKTHQIVKDTVEKGFCKSNA